MDHIAYIVLRANKKGERIGIVKLGESGYYVTDFDHHDTVEAARHHVRLINEHLGIPQEVEDAMMYGSCFGWHVPAAVPALRHFAAVEHQETHQ